MIDIRRIRGFFMGVLGWMPAAVMREAGLQDLSDAWRGHAAFYGLKPQAKAVSKEFLQEMMRKFPDQNFEGTHA